MYISKQKQLWCSNDNSVAVVGPTFDNLDNPVDTNSTCVVIVKEVVFVVYIQVQFKCLVYHVVYLSGRRIP